MLGTHFMLILYFLKFFFSISFKCFEHNIVIRIEHMSILGQIMSFISYLVHSVIYFYFFYCYINSSSSSGPWINIYVLINSLPFNKAKF